jgi:hypothetical protein
MAHARTTDPLTSHLAAASVTNQKTIRYWVLKLLDKPRTDVELVELFDKVKGTPRASQSGIRSRRAELVADGLIIDTGARKKLDSGRYATIWARK